MAVTVTDLALDARVITDASDPIPAGQQAILTRWLAVATTLVGERAPNAPQALRDAAALQLAGYLYERPAAGAGTRYANAWGNSGAAELLGPYVRRRAIAIARTEPLASGQGLDADAVRLLIAEHAAQADAHHEKTPPYSLPAAAPGVRGGVQAVTAETIDTGTSTGIFGWSIAHVRRLIRATVPLPAYLQAETQALFSRAGNLFWGTVNEVPDTPGEASGVDKVLAVTGENDRDYAWRSASEILELSAGGGLAFDGRGHLHTSPSLVATAAATDANAQAIETLRASGHDQVARDAVAAETAARQRAVEGEATARAQAIAAEATMRRDADTALGLRITALAAVVADPVYDPAHWVKSSDARTIIVHIDPATLTADVANLRLTISGISKTVAKVDDQDVYAFVFPAADSATITRSAGNAGRDTLTAELRLLTRANLTLERWLTVLRVLDSAPATGGVDLPKIRLANTNAPNADAATIAAALSRNPGGRNWRGYLYGESIYMPRAFDGPTTSSADFVVWVSGNTHAITSLRSRNSSRGQDFNIDLSPIAGPVAHAIDGEAGRYWTFHRTSSGWNSGAVYDAEVLTTGF